MIPFADLRGQLCQEAALFMKNSFAIKTRQSYSTHRKSYTTFCNMLNVQPVPSSTQTICLYAAYLARRLKYSSVKAYMNGVRLMHLDYGLPNPLENNFAYVNMMRGIRRCLGDSPNRKLPMTPKLLSKCLSYLNLNKLEDISTWTIMLLAFYGMLRMGSIVCQDGQCDHSKHLSMNDITPSPAGFIVVIRFTKTIQFQQRQLIITLPRLPGSILCPSQAMALYLMHRPRGVPNGGALFMRDVTGVPVTTASIRARIQRVLQLAGFAASEYGNHSMRRYELWLFLRLELGTSLD